MIKNRRIEWIDIYRGLGILLMVAGHVGFGSVFDKVIHGFHMPMWFFISGYLFQPGKRNLTGTIKHRAKKLMVPYYINLLVYYLFWLVFEKGFQNGAYTCLKSLCSMSLNIKSPIAGGAQWFLCALFLQMFSMRCSMISFLNLNVLWGFLFLFYPLLDVAYLC